ncbi:MAG: AEC family transporter [Rhodobacteraceae bacterium]|nr:AEC family transporter [Paracoccaceae bacterium]
MSYQVLSIVLPVFILIGLGYLAAKLGILSESVGEALGQYVFVVGIPVLLFKTLAVLQLQDENPWALWGAYFSGVAVISVLAHTIIRVVFKRDARAGVIGAISAAFANTVMVGLPLISSVYGEEGLTPLLILLSVHLPTLTVFIAISMERAATHDGVGENPDLLGLLANIVKRLMQNPIIIGILCALAWRMTGLPVQGIFKTVLDQIAATALPVALFSLGMSMVLYGIRGNILPGLVLSTLKTMVMPAVVFVFCAYVFHLSPLWTAVATITAASPTGVNAYIFANRYGTGHAMSANAITITTGFAVVTSGIWVTLMELWRATQ